MRDREEKKETERALENNEDQSNYLKKKKKIDLVLFTCTVFRPCAIDITEDTYKFSLVKRDDLEEYNDTNSIDPE